MTQSTQRTYQVIGMDCPECALKVEKGIKQLEGVRSVQVDFMSNRLILEGNASADSIQKRITDLGYQIDPTNQPARSESVTFTFNGFIQHLLQQSETRLGLGGLFLFLIALMLKTGSAPILFSQVLELSGLAIAGYPLAKNGISNLVINHDFNIDLLMSIAAVGAIVIGDIEEGVSLVLLFVLAEALEGYTTERARSVLGELANLAPRDCHAYPGQTGRNNSC